MLENSTAWVCVYKIQGVYKSDSKIILKPLVKLKWLCKLKSI